ncbi:hypothetical protein FA13DRAFT_1777067 [Coprinellus micaceus]|uniref:CHAT domain-containing protein n=1 Tax=Coprinellus micaceus TaxID=71717 RepID=A0A4Y7SWY4_COPMI|nr:hypothetical protein FA13DRAFT_1777067 [Coprinellus micaceus]
MKEYFRFADDISVVVNRPLTVRNHDIKHIDESIALFDIASTGISKDDPAYHDISDLHQLISLLQTAIDAFPQHRQELAEWRERLGSAYRFRYDALQNIDDLHEAASQYRQAAMFTLGTQRQRALCARMWALTADRLGKADESLEAYQLAVELGTLLTGLERSIGQRRVYLEEAHKLGLYIATKAVEKGEVERAVVWLEQGRGLLWRQLHHVRSPVDGLEAHNPDLAKRVREVSRKLEDGDLLSVSPESQPKVGGDMHWTLSMPKDVRRVVWKDNESTTRFALVLEWEAVLREVRQEEGFETFLRPPPIQDTTTYLPRQGFTILLHAHEEGSYAIIIDRDPNKETDVRLRSIPLTDFTFTKGEAMVRELHTRLNAAGLRGSEERTGDLDDTEDPTRALKAFVRPNARQTTITSVLKNLWNVVVKPIVEYLELKPSNDPSERARIWWCATGPLALLPIHAAGDHQSANGANLGGVLVDYAVSSYTPTLATLAKLVQDESSQPYPGTDHPLQSCSTWVHFACHASQDDHDPLKSGFSLEGGKLTLADIIRRRHEVESTPKSSMALAFLSACQTSTETENFSEEAVHLVAGMLAAGYRGVVGTMWGIPDKYAPVIAEEFYRTATGSQ